MIKKPSRPAHSQPPAPISSSQQFNATPRFSFAVANAFHLDTAHSLNQYATPARQAPRQQDVIEDDADEAQYAINNIHDSIESAQAELHQQYLSADEEGDYDLISPRPKRR